MKKYYIGAAMMAVLATACTNDEIVEQSMDNGQLFEITADHGMASRTVLNSDATKTLWQAGDKIFVTSLDGDVTGELTLKKGAGLEKATFAGKVNGDPAKLKYAVYPAPVDGVINMGTLADGELDAPMFGSLDEAKNVTFANECALVKVQIDGAAGKDVNVKVDGLAGGQYALSYEDYSVSLNYTKSQGGMTITGISEDGLFYVPVYAGGNIVALDAAAARADVSAVTKEMTITIGNQTIKQNVSITAGTIDKSVKPMQYVEGEYFNMVETFGGDADERKDLLEAILAGNNVTLTEAQSLGTSEIVVINHGKNATIDLGGKSLYVDKKIYIENGSLTIKNGLLAGGEENSGIVQLRAKEGNEVGTAEFNVAADAVVSAKGYGVGIWEKVSTDANAVINVEGKINAKYFALYTNGENVANCTVNVKEGAIVTSCDAAAIYLPTGSANVQCELKGAEITGKDAAVEVRGGNLNIVGGKLTATAEAFSTNANGNGSSICGAAVAISQHTTNLPINVEINGGEFKGTYALYEEDLQDEWYEEDITISITDGVFTSTGYGDPKVYSPIFSENVISFIKGGYFSSGFDTKYLNSEYQLIKEETGDYINWFSAALKVAE